MMKLFRLAYSNASFIVGLITGAAGLASNLASILGLELIGFPGILIGYYRSLVFQLFFWSPDWWHEWLSHLITLYIAMGLSLARAVVSISKPTATFRTMISNIVFWPINIISMIIKKHQHDRSVRMKEASWMKNMTDVEQLYLLSNKRYILETIIVASLTPIFAVFLLAWSGLEHQLGI